MPMRRCSGGTTPCGEESNLPATSMVPASGVRKPASVRSIVVLPQPEGPSRVMNSCSWIDRSTPISARKPSKRLSMPAMSMNAIALAPHRGRLARRPARAGQPADEPSERQNYGDGENGERRDDLKLPQIVEAINGNGNGLGAARVEQDGGAELTEGCNEHQQECDEKARARKRKQNAADCEPPGCAGDASRLLQRRIDLAEGGVDAARGQRDEACDVGSKQDPDGAVDRHRQPDESQQDADRHHRAR